MVEFGILAGTAIGIAGDFLAGVVQNMAADAVTDLVRRCLRTTDEGNQALGRLEESPQDPERRMRAASALATTAQNDSACAQALKEAVNAYLQAANQGVATSGSPHHQVNVNGGGITGKGAQVAGGNIDNSKRSNKFRFGGAIGALLLLGGGIGGVLYASSDGSGSPGFSGFGAFGSAGDVASVGAAPGEDGVRQTWMAYAQAISGKDARTACALYTPEARTEMEKKQGKCEDYFEEAFDNADSGTLQALASGKKVKVSEIVVNSGEAELELRTPGDTSADPGHTYMERFSDRWRISGRFLYRHFHECPTDPQALSRIYVTGEGDSNCLIEAG
ncbi:hypothetical protein ACFY71_05880 [Streptomyces cinerochromogenes]|uniref:hypothetical protein n=1 Tax=Streptomyces cinerochromogenes TaxID=66422 RepID=UPI0036B16CE5